MPDLLHRWFSKRNCQRGPDITSGPSDSYVIRRRGSPLGAFGPSFLGVCMSQINLEYTSTRQYSVSYFGDGSEPTLSLCVKRGRFLLLLCSEHQISLRAKHNPRPGIVLVDYLSEGLGGSASLSEWSFHHSVAVRFIQLWVPLRVDLLSGRPNHKLDCHMSLWY